MAYEYKYKEFERYLAHGGTRSGRTYAKLVYGNLIARILNNELIDG